MFGLFRKKKKIPDLSPESSAVAEATVKEIRRQAGEFFGESIGGTLPDLNDFHLENIAGYANGFVSGMLQVGKQDLANAKGDHAIAEMVRFALTVGVFTAIFGPLRGMKAMEFAANPGARFMQLDRIGGTDGIAHAQGQPKQNGGLLLHYLRHNYNA